MQFNIAALTSFALALSASATPIAGLEKRDEPVCLNRGPDESRAKLINRIDDYCTRHYDWVVKQGYTFVEDQQMSGHPLHIGIVGEGKCEWNIGQECFTNFRKILDGCNTEAVDGKQGGWFHDNCGTYWLTMVDN